MTTHIQNLFDLSGRVAIVTGGSRGLGLVLARPVMKSQIEQLAKLYQSELAAFTANEKDAMQLATKPIGALPPGLTAAEAAAWTVVANVLLNLDGVLTKG